MADLRKPDTPEPSGVAERFMESGTDILALERQIVALQREIDKPESALPDEELEVLVDQQNELDLKILALPASTAREVDAKLRRVLAWLAQDRGGFFEEIREAMYGTIAGGEVPEAETTNMTDHHEDAVLEASVALADAYQKVEEKTDRMIGLSSDPAASEKARRESYLAWADKESAENKLLETEATTDQGRFLKMVLALCLFRCSFDFEVQDCEGLADRVDMALKLTSHVEGALPILLRSPLLAGQRETLRPYLVGAECEMVSNTPDAETATKGGTS